MEKNITVTTLGTSHGSPTRERYNTSTLVELPDMSFMIDSGAPALGQLVRCGIQESSVKHIFITHMHEDHVGGLPDMVKFMSKGALKDYEFNIWLPEAEAEEGLRAFCKSMHVRISEKISFHVIEAGTLIDTPDFKVEAYLTDHFGYAAKWYPSFAFGVFASSKRMLFTGDLSSDFHDFPQGLDMDFVLCELTHYKLENAIPILAKQHFGKLVFNHVGNPWHGEENVERWRNLVKDLPYPAFLAWDMDKFTV